MALNLLTIIIYSDKRKLTYLLYWAPNNLTVIMFPTVEKHHVELTDVVVNTKYFTAKTSIIR